MFLRNINNHACQFDGQRLLILSKLVILFEVHYVFTIFIKFVNTEDLTTQYSQAHHSNCYEECAGCRYYDTKEVKCITTFMPFWHSFELLIHIVDSYPYTDSLEPSL